MGAITVLDERLCNRIAAGEVVERPAAAIKELIENALDAGATRVIVELRDGGLEAIRVTDNGGGIAAGELDLAVARHATSKIRTVADLDAIATLGFRGEALPSIAAVSRFTLASRPAGAAAGAWLRLEGGTPAGGGVSGMAPGTTVEADNLFFNAPARRKFLKAAPTELRYVLEIVNHLSLSRPEVEFLVRNGGHEALHYPACAAVADRLLQVFGRDFSRNMFTAEAAQEDHRLRAYGAKPALARGNSRGIVSFINGRFFRGREVMSAVREGYRRYLPAGKWPFAVLFLEVPLDRVDVNVHPQKTEVRFREPGRIHALIRNAFSRALSDTPVAVAYPAGGVEPPWAGRRGPAAPAAVHEPSAALFEFPPPAAGREGAPRSDFGPASAAPPVRPAATPAGRAFQVYDAYIVEETPAGIMVHDQHALHEGLMEIRLRRAFAAQKFAVQELLIPEQIDLPPADRAQLLELAGVLRECGFEIQPFSGNTVVFHAVPAVFDTARLGAFVADILAIEDAATADADAHRAVIQRIINRTACHSSIRAGQRLKPEEISELLAAARAEPESGSCAHGRPASFLIPKADIERRFQRK
ncbi:MAG: DNA mismatch repair endonuclease MutL [Planctomycetota bacterium]